MPLFSCPPLRIGRYFCLAGSRFLGAIAAKQRVYTFFLKIDVLMRNSQTIKGGETMAVFRVERNKGYTVMSNHHLRNRELSLKAKGLLSQMLSLPEDWDYTLAGLSYINRESIDAIRTAVWELEKAGYIRRSQSRDDKGKMAEMVYTIYEQPVLENPTSDNPVSENPM
jgi:hypothetical protein